MPSREGTICRMQDDVLVLQDIQKIYGSVEALRGISLRVRRGSFVTLLGPSGCGKTTTLRIIAGLEYPDGGSVMLDGQDVANLPPNKRAVNTVFQSYALFPHMTVAKNIGYGLRIKGIDKTEIARKVEEMLDMVQLSCYGKRMPAQLSGGQRQRVAIARAMINNPKILLLDEPLGALDLQLRRQMQLELKKLQRSSGITFIYITHDQEEALNMSDQIAIMNEGRFEQIGTPDEIYEHPRTRFAAQFIGQTNLIDATVEHVIEGGAQLRFAGGSFPVLAEGLREGQPVTVSVRAERADFNTEESREGFSLRGTITETLYAGGSVRTTVALAGGQEIQVSGLLRDDKLPDGTQVHLFWDPRQAAVIDEAGAPHAT